MANEINKMIDFTVIQNPIDQSIYLILYKNFYHIGENRNNIENYFNVPPKAVNAIYESMNGNFSEGYVVMMQDPTGETDSSLLK